MQQAGWVVLTSHSLTYWMGIGSLAKSTLMKPVSFLPYWNVHRAEQGIKSGLLSHLYDKKSSTTYLPCGGAHTLAPSSGLVLNHWNLWAESIRISSGSPTVFCREVRAGGRACFLVIFWTHLENSKSGILFRTCKFICSLFCPHKYTCHKKLFKIW